jgi:hypothetical protein
MHQGVPIVGIRFPDPGPVEAVDGLVSALAVDPVVRFVRKAYMPAPHVVPVLTPPLDVINDYKYIEHHLAIGAGAAWNVRAALPSVAARPFVVVADYFGNGPPDDAGRGRATSTLKRGRVRTDIRTGIVAALDRARDPMNRRGRISPPASSQGRCRFAPSTAPAIGRRTRR